MRKTGFFHSQIYQGLAAVLLLLFIGTELDASGIQLVEAVSTPRTTSTAQTLEPKPLPRLILPSQIHPAVITPVSPPAPLEPQPVPSSEPTPEESATSSPKPESSEESNQTKVPDSTPSPAPTPTPTPTASPSPTTSLDPDMAEIEALIQQIEFELDNLPA